MKPTDELRSEHRTICRALSGLTQAARVLEKGLDVPEDLLRNEMDFIKNFTDKCHHKKEEAVLFPTLEHQFVLRAHDPVPEMLKEHELARHLVDRLDQAIKKYGQGDPDQKAEIVRLSQQYRALLIEHIRKENTILTEMVEKDLPADKKLEVAERFQAVEDEFNVARRDNYVMLADRLHEDGKKLAA